MSLYNSNNKLMIWVAVIFCFFVSSLFQHTMYSETGVFVSIVTTLIVYVFFTSGQTFVQYKFVTLSVCFLFIYTIIFSLYVSRSAIYAFNALAGFCFFCAIKDKKLHNIIGSETESNGYSRYKQTAKIVIVLILSAHILLQLYQYATNPIRVTGIFADYGQSAFSILIAYAFIYPFIRDKWYLSPVTLISFAAFFTSFSRTANALLVIFFLMLLFWEFKKGKLTPVINIAIALFVALVMVYAYPIILDLDVVNRGGVSIENIGTLNSRTLYWSAAWESILNRPLLGHGLGNYEWSGIKLVFPFQYIPNVHNDYLQLWLDLGLFWMLYIVAAQIYFLLKYCPISFSLKKGIYLNQTSQNLTNYIAWTTLICISLYMTINFIIGFLFFQFLIVLLICEVIDNAQN